MQLLSPAKINLFLYVIGKRQNGFHNIYSLMCPINLFDTIFLNFNRKKISVECYHKDIPNNEENIVYKAAELFFKTININQGINIIIDKRIPVGAGLGGGSSNAATVLLALNRFFNKPLSNEELLSVGLKLGADVPFFIFGKPAIASGIGEILENCSVKPYYILLIYPGIKILTPEIYKKINLSLTKCPKKIKKILLQVKKDNVHFDIRGHLWNDLETVTSDLYFEIYGFKKLLLDHEAEGVLMSGSGSTVFGLYSNQYVAKKNFVKLKISCKKFEKYKNRCEFFLAKLLVDSKINTPIEII